MQRFSGLEIKPYSQLTELPRVRIDRVRVEVQRTLFGEVEYHLVGTYGDEGRAYPICQPFAARDGRGKTAACENVSSRHAYSRYFKGDRTGV